MPTMIAQAHAPGRSPGALSSSSAPSRWTSTTSTTSRS